MRSLGRLTAFWRVKAVPRLHSLLGWLLVVYLAATMLLQFDEDTTDISGAAFVVASILAALAFTYAGVIPESGDKDDVVHAGERLSQGAMLFLAASLLKYGAIAIPFQLARLSSVRYFAVHEADVAILVLALQAFLFLVFLAALLVSQLGYRLLGQVVVKRAARRGRTAYFPPTSQPPNSLG